MTVYTVLFTPSFDYSLRMAQKLFNPLEVFVYRGVGFLGTLGMISLTAKYRACVPLWLLTCFFVLLFRRFLLGTIMLFFKRDSSRHITLTMDAVGFGKRQPEYWLSRKPLKVQEGVFNTYLIRNPYGFTLIVPKSIISFSELKRRVEMEQTAPPRKKSPANILRAFFLGK